MQHQRCHRTHLSNNRDGRSCSGRSGAGNLLLPLDRNGPPRVLCQ